MTARRVLEPIRCAEGFTAWRMQTGKLPLEAGARPALARVVAELMRGAEAALGCSARLWLDTRKLHEDGGSKIFGKNARAWQPEMGFCFDPSEPPPRKLTIDDLLTMDWGTEVKIHDRTAIYIAAGDQTKSAYETMAGRGLAVLVLFANDAGEAADRYNRHTKKELQKAMAPGQFQGFAFYLPLLTSAGVAGATREQLQLWLDDAMLYLREDEENGELVVVARASVHAAFASAGWRRTGETETMTLWERMDENDER